MIKSKIIYELNSEARSIVLDNDKIDNFGRANKIISITPLEKETDYDYINPSHYQQFSKEVYEMMINIWGKEAYITYCEMAAFKYRMRLGLKPGQPVEQELEKIKWYESKAKELRK